MTLKTWIFPEHGGIIPGIPGQFHGGLKVIIDEETGTVNKIELLNPPVLPEESVKMTIDSKGTQEIVTPGYKKKTSESSDS
jgi:hypothetical protein